MLDGFKAMRASLEAMQQASGQSGWMAFSRLVLRAIDLPPPNNLAMARGLGEGATGSGRIRPTRLYGASNLLRRDRLPRPRDHVLGRGVELLHQVLDLGAGEGRDIKTSLFGVLEELLVAHGGVESGPQNAELLRRQAGRRNIRALEHLLADHQLDHFAIVLVLHVFEHRRDAHARELVVRLEPDPAAAG